jgi:hypothetical protein
MNQGRDTVAFRHGSGDALTAAPAFAAFESVRIFRDGNPWFSGIITGLPAAGTAAGEGQNYVVSGPWWYLENTIYQQAWNVVADPSSGESTLETTWKSHLILGQNVSGGTLTLRQQLVDILDYAIAAGAPMDYQLAESGLDFQFPMDECRDLGCAEALQRVLRWAPSFRLWFDYSEEIPVLHCTGCAGGTPWNLSLSDGVESLAVAPQHGLQLVGVAVKYERIHRSNGHVWRTLEVDRYPQNISETQPRVLVLTVELAGSRSQHISQKITARTVDASSARWWKLHLPALANIPDEDLEILSHGRSSTLPRELVDGCIADWMAVEAETDVVRATVAYAAGGAIITSQEVAVRLVATDATTRTYGHLASFDGGEDSPVGLAQSLHEGFSSCPYAGSLRLVDPEVRDISMGSPLNIAGGQTAWATMGAEIQECVEEVDTGTVRLRFGPPGHLGLQQLVQLTRMNRGREAPAAAGIRGGGDGSAGSIEQPSRTPVENSHVGATVYAKILLANGEDGTRQISLDADLLPTPGLVLRPREEFVAENGILRKRLAIASQPYPVETD